MSFYGQWGEAAGTTGAVRRFLGTWNASTNTPTIVSSTGTQGDYYVVTVAGSTNIDGETGWQLGDEIAFNGSVWERIPNPGVTMADINTAIDGVFTGTTEGRILRKGSGSTLVDSSLDDSGTEVDSDKSVALPPAFLDLGPLRLSAGNRTINAVNTAKNIQALVNPTPYTSSGSEAPRTYTLAAESDNAIQPLFDETDTGTIVFTYTVARNRHVTAFKVRIDTAIPAGSSGTFRNTNAGGGILFFLEVEGLGTGEQTIQLENPQSFLAGDVIHVTLEVGAGVVEGHTVSGTFIPYVVSVGHDFDIDNIATQDFVLQETQLHQPRLNSFTINNQARQVQAGTSLSGSREFDYDVELPSEVGTGTLLQGTATINSSVNPLLFRVIQTINSVVLNAGESVTFTLRFPVIVGPTIGSNIERTFTVSAAANSQLLYWGVFLPDVTAGQFSTSGASHAHVAQNQTIQIPQFADSRRLMIAQPNLSPDITSIIIDNVNQIGAFTQTDSAITVDGVNYDVWRSNQTLDGTIVSGLSVELRR